MFVVDVEHITLTLQSHLIITLTLLSHLVKLSGNLGTGRLFSFRKLPKRFAYSAGDPNDHLKADLFSIEASSALICEFILGSWKTSLIDCGYNEVKVWRKAERLCKEVSLGEVFDCEKTL